MKVAISPSCESKQSTSSVPPLSPASCSEPATQSPCSLLGSSLPPLLATTPQALLFPAPGAEQRACVCSHIHAQRAWEEEPCCQGVTGCGVTGTCGLAGRFYIRGGSVHSLLCATRASWSWSVSAAHPKHRVQPGHGAGRTRVSRSVHEPWQASGSAL